MEIFVLILKNAWDPLSRFCCVDLSSIKLKRRRMREINLLKSSYFHLYTCVQINTQIIIKNNNKWSLSIISHNCIVTQVSSLILSCIHAPSNKFQMKKRRKNFTNYTNKLIHKRIAKHHTNLLKGLLPTVAGIETVESMLKSPRKCEEICFSVTFWAAAASLPEPLFHLKAPMFDVRENENRLFDVSFAGASTCLSFGLLLALAFALAEAVGVM